MSLAEIGTNIEEIVRREVARIAGSGDALDEKSVRVVESLSKILDHCLERRKSIEPSDPYASVPSDTLAAEFE